jgi:hypothetical protein
MEEQQLERKFRELGQSLQELKSNAVGDMQLLKMMLGCSLGLQLMIFLLMIFGASVTTWLGLAAGS